jgi:hypothetical protein
MIFHEGIALIKPESRSKIDFLVLITAYSDPLPHSDRQDASVQVIIVR